MKNATNDNPRILFLDIETKLVELYSFGIRDQYITHKQIKDLDASARSIHCVGLKWAGERKVRVLSEWNDGYRGMIEGVHAALSEADAVATYNGANFDMPKLEGQFLLLGMEPPPPPTQIDIFKTTRKMGFVSSKLDYIAPILGLGSKVKHPGLEMWIDCHNGCDKAQAKMTRYCAGDVRLTEEVYDKVRPYIRNHPHLHRTPPHHCGACGSGHVHVSKYRRTKGFRIQQLHCQSCGSYFDGKREAA